MLKMAALKMIQGGGSSAVAGNLLSGLLGMAHGGVLYQGNGGTDSQIYAFRKSPNENVTHVIETPEQRRTGALWGGGSRGPTSVHVHMQNDRRDLVESFDSSEGERVFVRLNRRLGG
jgi:hypothetical protein